MVSKPPAARGKPETSADASTKETPKHTRTQGVALLFLLPRQKLQNKTIIEEVEAGVYSLSGLGQMHRVRGLHKRLPGQLL